MANDTGTEDPRIFYTARDGKVYDEDGNEAGTARTANGRDLERHAEALETAKKQRAAIERAGKLAPVLVRPAGSHSLELNRSGRSGFGPFSKEELFPILELTAPRVGFVRAHMSADRYVHSSGWSEWRIYLRDVRKPDDEKPDVPHLGKPAAGVGDATRAAIGRACVPLVEEWLESDAYARSRQRAAAYALKRELDAPADYTIERSRRTLEELTDELAPGDRVAFGRALEQLAGARQILDAIALGD